jgi:hypothetical protein
MTASSRAKPASPATPPLERKRARSTTPNNESTLFAAAQRPVMY